MVKRAKDYLTPDTIAAKCDDYLAHIRSRVRPRPQLVLHPPHCALLVIDMVQYFADPQGRAYLPASRAIVERIAKLLLMWRSLSAPVFFTRHCHRGPSDLGMLGRFYNDYIRCDAPEASIIEALAPNPRERVVRKTTYDSFHDTPLADLLAECGAKQVLICGVLTHLCCETTARSAFVRGYEVYLPVDATCSSSEALHLGSLLGLADGVAVLHSTDEILAMDDTLDWTAVDVQ